MIKLTDLLNENRPPSPKDVKDWIESFNNAAWIKNAAGYYLFRASDFALKGIKRELKDSGIHIRHFPKNAYGIPVSQKNDFHWGTNESVSESKYKAHVFSDVVHDIVSDEKFKNVDYIKDGDFTNDTVRIYIKDRDKSSAKKIIKTLQSKYGVEGKWNERESAVEVSGSSLVD